MWELLQNLNSLLNSEIVWELLQNLNSLLNSEIVGTITKSESTVKF
ncbi:hypothetical protein G436_1690 [Leptospira interrogans serovar Hardjo str. Norma]|uniref:Uncharacterized protein n=1 Tax=Leptospira interrogans serovar Hardjo str. Norma TaxID=1279460 RepID=A0A0M4N4V1_LEPIR|nr:hypothetical protein G436_1690 [Leptospira interrogans serovar Hardjo str. Norma]